MNTEYQNSMVITLALAQDSNFGETASTPKVLSWQYNGVAHWVDILEWCYHNLYHGGNYEPNWYTNNRDTFYFKDPKEYTLFLLRWT